MAGLMLWHRNCSIQSIKADTKVGKTLKPKIEEIKMKTAIIVLSDPKNGSEESLGRVFNALATAYDYKNAGKEVSILFQGT